MQRFSVIVQCGNARCLLLSATSTGRSYFIFGLFLFNSFNRVFKINMVYYTWLWNHLLILPSSTNPRQLNGKISTYFFIALLCLLYPSSYDSQSLLCQSFVKFFSDKIHKLHTSLLISHTLLPFLFYLLHLTSYPTLVLSLLRFLSSSLSLLALIGI